MNLNKKPRKIPSRGRQKVISAIVLQLAIIFGMIVFKYAVLTLGTEVLLHIRPVDPRDPLRGDYVTFQYDIGSVDRNLFDYRYTPRNGDQVYVPLAQRGKYWVIDGTISNLRPKNNELYIKARIESGGDTRGMKDIDMRRMTPEEVTLKYGIEEYFIPEGAGREFGFWNKENYALVAVDDDGNAVLKGIFVDDEPWP